NIPESAVQWDQGLMFTQPLTIRRIGKYQSVLEFAVGWPTEFFERFAHDTHELIDARRNNIALRRSHRQHMLIVAANLRQLVGQPLLPSLLSFSLQSCPQLGIVLQPAEKTEIVAEYSRRNIGSHQCSFDKQSAAATHGINESSAFLVQLRPP